jgi:hypothetical protein
MKHIASDIENFQLDYHQDLEILYLNMHLKDKPIEEEDLYERVCFFVEDAVQRIDVALYDEDERIDRWVR